MSEKFKNTTDSTYTVPLAKIQSLRVKPSHFLQGKLIWFVTSLSNHMAEYLQNRKHLLLKLQKIKFIRKALVFIIFEIL